MRLDKKVKNGLEARLEQLIPEPHEADFDDFMVALEQNDPQAAEELNSAIIFDEFEDPTEAATRGKRRRARSRGVRHALLHRYDELTGEWVLSRPKAITAGFLAFVGLFGLMFFLDGSGTIKAKEMSRLASDTEMVAQDADPIAAKQLDSSEAAALPTLALGVEESKESDVPPPAEDPFTDTDSAVISPPAPTSAPPVYAPPPAPAASPTASTASAVPLPVNMQLYSRGNAGSVIVGSRATPEGDESNPTMATRPGSDPFAQAGAASSASSAAGTTSGTAPTASVVLFQRSTPGTVVLSNSDSNETASKKGLPPIMIGGSESEAADTGESATPSLSLMSADADSSVFASADANFSADTRPAEPSAAPVTVSPLRQGSFAGTAPAVPQPVTALKATYVPGETMSGELATGLIATEGQTLPALIRTPDGSVWQGSAALAITGRIKINLHTVYSPAGTATPVRAIVLSPLDAAAGIPASIQETTPSLASDLFRGALGGVTDYVQSLSEAGTVTMGENATVITQEATPLEWSIAGNMAETMTPSEASRPALVRVATVPAGAPVTVMVLGQAASGSR